MKFISTNILTGLVTILPVLLTVYLLYWLAVSAESLLGGLLQAILPDFLYWPGMGLVAGLAVVFAVGLLMRAYLVQRLFELAEGFLYHMPLIKTVYRAIRDFFDYFDPARKKDFGQVVAVSFGDAGMQLIGFVTQQQSERLPPALRDGERVLVYLPMSYMIGGYAVLVPRSAVTPLDMHFEEAMRFTLTAGVTGVAKPATP